MSAFYRQDGQVVAVRFNTACPGGLLGETHSDGEVDMGADRQRESTAWVCCLGPWVGQASQLLLLLSR